MVVTKHRRTDTAKESVAPVSTITTKAELLARLRNRPKPTREIQLTPQGWETTEIRRKVNSLSENRIKDLQTRLDTVREKCANDFSKAQMKGKAKGDFTRML